MRNYCQKRTAQRHANRTGAKREFIRASLSAAQSATSPLEQSSLPPQQQEQDKVSSAEAEWPLLGVFTLFECPCREYLCSQILQKDRQKSPFTSAKTPQIPSALLFLEVDNEWKFLGRKGKSTANRGLKHGFIGWKGKSLPPTGMRVLPDFFFFFFKLGRTVWYLHWKFGIHSYYQPRRSTDLICILISRVESLRVFPDPLHPRLGRDTSTYGLYEISISYNFIFYDNKWIEYQIGSAYN